MDNLVYEKFFAMLRDRFGEREYRLASSALAINLPRGGISLVSTNPAFAPIFFNDEKIKTLPVSVIGRVVELRAKF